MLQTSAWHYQRNNRVGCFLLVVIYIHTQWQIDIHLFSSRSGPAVYVVPETGCLAKLQLLKLKKSFHKSLPLCRSCFLVLFGLFLYFQNEKYEYSLVIDYWYWINSRNYAWHWKLNFSPKLFLTQDLIQTCPKSCSYRIFSGLSLQTFAILLEWISYLNDFELATGSLIY